LVIYLDTSALLKLVLVEERSDVLCSFLERRRSEQMVLSVLLTIETRRAVQEVSAFVTDDRRLGTAAEAANLPVVAPS
jgi:hypothetical protein